jgi:hypothetical protein
MAARVCRRDPTRSLFGKPISLTERQTTHKASMEHSSRGKTITYTIEYSLCTALEPTSGEFQEIRYLSQVRIGMQSNQSLCQIINWVYARLPTPTLQTWIFIILVHIKYQTLIERMRCGTPTGKE